LDDNLNCNAFYFDVLFPVQVRLASPLFTWFYGDVIYATPDGEVFDVALIQLRHYRGPTNLPPMDELTAEAVMGNVYI